MSDTFNQAAPASSLPAEWQNHTLEEAQALARQYPYFAPAHFLLLQKLPRSSEEYLRQYQKAILYHKDVLEFENLLHSDRFITDFGPVVQETEVPLPDTYEDLAIAEEVPIENVEPLPALEEPKKEAPLLPPPAPVEQTDEEKIEDHLLPPAEPVASLSPALPEIAPEALIENSEPEPSTPPVILPETVQAVEAAAPMEVPATLAPAPAEELAFEPYHTVDYFASQGIKAPKEPAPDDRFGKQLKSFTQWLKEMKRLSPADLSNNLDPKTEQNVENLAEHSLQNPDVATEAMAEVWIKQGNRQKAAEVYRKLSLLNPAKSSYFAAKIENLNGS